MHRYFLSFFFFQYLVREKNYFLPYVETFLHTLYICIYMETQILTIHWLCKGVKYHVRAVLFAIRIIYRRGLFKCINIYIRVYIWYIDTQSSRNKNIFNVHQFVTIFQLFIFNFSILINIFQIYSKLLFRKGVA